MALPPKQEPSIAAIAVATAIISGLTGYYIGQARSIGLFGGSSSTSPTLSDTKKQDETSDISDAGSDASDAPELGDLKTFEGGNEECKLVLVVRTDLGMTKGEWLRLDSIA
jgi:hypothetical protein